MRAPPTPSSLKWLITRHARLEGEIAKLQAAEDVRQADVKTQLAALERQLKCAMAHERRQQIRLRGIQCLGMSVPCSPSQLKAELDVN